MEFYDELARFYHLIYEDWDETVDRQAYQLSSVIESEWPKAQSILDVSCGIGTQSIGLAKRGFTVTSSDMSPGAIERAKAEAVRFGVQIAFSVCDMRQAHGHHGVCFDVVISCDNSLPHLLTDQDLVGALKEMYSCLSPGGGCVISVRDYEIEPRGRGVLKPYGVRTADGYRYLPFQVWDFEGEHYDFTFYVVEENCATQEIQTHAFRSRFYAIPIPRLCDLMSAVGFGNIKRIDGVYFQPVLTGTKGA